MNPDNPAGLEAQVRDLTTRVWRLEAALHQHGIVVGDEPAHPAADHATSGAASPQSISPQSASWAAEVQRIASLRQQAAPHPQAAATIPAQEPAQVLAPIAEPHVPPPSFGYAPQPTNAPGPNAASAQSLESKIGSQWFNRIAILAILIAVALFLKMAFDNHWIGPLGRVFIGLVAGAGIIAWSELFHKKGFTAFAYSLKAIGSGVLYLSLWASFSVFHLVPAGVAFGAMILVTAFNGFMAWVEDAELLALYAIAGGLSTPLLLSTGENHEVTLFSYLLILDIAVLLLAALKPWSRLLFAAFVGTVVFVIGWWATFYADSAFGITAFFVGCFFLMFAFAPHLVRVNGDDGVTLSGWDTLAGVLMPLANAGVGFVAFYALFDGRDAGWADPWLAVMFAAFYLALLQVPATGKLRTGGAVLSGLHLTLAVVFLTIAIPLKAKGPWLTIGWLAEGAALLWGAARLRSLLLRVLSIGCLILGLGALLVMEPPVAPTPFFNQQFGAYCAGIAAFAIACWIAYNAQTKDDPQHKDGWRLLALLTGLVVSGLILLSVSIEIHHYWMPPMRGRFQPVSRWSMYEQFTYSAWFMAYGAILLAAGFSRRSAFLRWQALVLLAVSIAKVFLVDVSELAEGYRILSFLGLGALLLGVSYVYQRDWLNLRDPNRRDS
ncbi:MAG: DUF2339 domain-containing protein [Terracidiphilus sp.]|jgi:uncharacterized membrane protein